MSCIYILSNFENIALFMLRGGQKVHFRILEQALMTLVKSYRIWAWAQQNLQHDMTWTQWRLKFDCPIAHLL